MPNMRVDDLKDSGSRIPAQEWQRSLGLKDMTTNEWNEAASRAASGETTDSIGRDLQSRRRP